MNIDALLVLQRSDVEHIAAHREQFAGTRLLFIDAGILEDALQAGLQHYELRHLPVGRDMGALNFAQATTAAASIDLALTALRTELWGPGAFHGWDQSLLQHPLTRAFAMRSIRAAVEAAWPEKRLGLLRPDNPAASHWDSMLSTDIVAADPARWSIVGSYPKSRYWNSQLLEVCFDFAGVRRQVEAGDADCLTHIPTCFYDAAAFASAISQAFPRNIDLPSLMWDVPVRRGEHFHLQRLDAVPADRSCERYRERARQVLTDHLGRLILTRATLEQQADAFADRCHLQAVNFVGLRQSLAGSRPHVVLSDHDAGNNGPLFSLAAELDSPITVLPHSAYPTSRMPHARRVTVVELEGAGVPVVTVLGLPVATRAVRFRDLPQPEPRTAPRRVCLLLNSMTAEGLCYVDFFALIAFHKALAALCSTVGWDLCLRLKPGSPALNVVASALRLPVGALSRTMAQPIEDVARDADICIAFGDPSSATVVFFNAGSYLVHVSDQEWPRDYRHTSPFAELMPTERCETAPAEIERLMRDPALYSQKHQQQIAQYSLRRAAAQATLFAATPSGDDTGRLPASAA